MSNFILTGTPGSGKTAILRQLEIHGYAVVEEAATDVIALHHALGHREPWRDPDFIDRIVDLQRKRQLAVGPMIHRTTFFDRSPVCTLALSRHLALAAPRPLLDEIDRVLTDHVYERTVFFVRSQGFVQATAARRISLEDSHVFEQIHEDTYRSLGFELIAVAPDRLPARVAVVEDVVEGLRRKS
ncbi:AAA family ATPase [Actinoplanes sp. NPDC051470]|uniref:AAA family ATPase n=1 Tax=Actinoplanes sp. NPDC051470 TaxID=3157224 RepID=UPI00342DCD25